VKAVVRAGNQHPGEIDVRPDDTMGSEFDVFINNGVRADTNGRIQPRFRMNDSRGMNHR
jgi:hypothetical protein